jgi:hypothetical protein
LALLLFEKMVKRAFEGSDPLGHEMKIDEGGFYGRMSKESFNGVKVSSLVEQVGCKTVAKGMDTPAPGYTGFFLASE